MNMTSLPEVLGDGAIFVDGKDVQTWANVIQRALTDHNLRNDLTDRS
jgi:glycosyltransferase involved in cell wall biosynthesis